MKETVCIQSLPAEILELILDYLDEDPPSYNGHRKRPTVDLISSKYKHPPLKSFSRVSKANRRITMHRLFRHTMHLVTFEARDQEFRNEGLSFCEWPRKFWEFITLLKDLNLGGVVRSFTLAIKGHKEIDKVYNGQTLSVNVESKPISVEAAEYQCRWVHLFSRATPLLSRVTIVAPPLLLGALVGLPTDPSAAYISYQILSLWIQPSLKQYDGACADRSSMSFFTLFTAHPWTHMLLNEGYIDLDLSEGPSRQDDMVLGLLGLQQDYKVFPAMRSVSYTSTVYPPRTFSNFKLLLGSLPKLVEFYFSIDMLFPPSPDSLRYNLADVARMEADRQDLRLDLMEISLQEEEIADQLGLEKCLEHLMTIVCLDDLEPEISYGSLSL